MTLIYVTKPQWLMSMSLIWSPDKKTRRKATYDRKYHILHKIPMRGGLCNDNLHIFFLGVLISFTGASTAKRRITLKSELSFYRTTWSFLLYNYLLKLLHQMKIICLTPKHFSGPFFHKSFQSYYSEHEISTEKSGSVTHSNERSRACPS